MLGARPTPADRAPTGSGPPLSARMWEPSITALDMSSRSAARSSAGSTSCRRCRTRHCSSAAACASRSCPSRKLDGQPLAPDARVADGQDAAQHLAVLPSLPAGVPEPALPDRQQRLDSDHNSSPTRQGRGSRFLTPQQPSRPARSHDPTAFRQELSADRSASQAHCWSSSVDSWPASSVARS